MQLPPSLGEDVQIACKFWAVRLHNGTDQRILEHVIISPVISLLDEELKSQVYTAFLCHLCVMWKK